MTKTHEKHQHKGFIEDQRQFFDDLITQDWDSYINPLWDLTRQLEVQGILERIPAPARVLDVGCGSGYHDIILAEHMGVQEVVGIDYSTRSIEQANRHYPHPKVKRQVGDIFETAQLMQVLGQFDLVASFQVFEHVTQARDFLGACTKLTRQNGYVAIVTPNGKRLENRLVRLWGGSPRTIDPLHFKEYGVDEISSLAESLDLKLVGYFGHTLHFSLPILYRLNFLWGNRPRIGTLFPRYASVIGVILHKED